MSPRTDCATVTLIAVVASFGGSCRWPRRRHCARPRCRSSPTIPYFSIWSPADRLTDAATVHWTGRTHPLTSLVRIDGETSRLMGPTPTDIAALPQTSVTVLPTRTIYVFANKLVRVTLTFMTPSLPVEPRRAVAAGDVHLLARRIDRWEAAPGAGLLRLWRGHRGQHDGPGGATRLPGGAGTLRRASGNAGAARARAPRRRCAHRLGLRLPRRAERGGSGGVRRQWRAPAPGLHRKWDHPGAGTADCGCARVRGASHDGRRVGFRPGESPAGGELRDARVRRHQVDPLLLERPRRVLAAEGRDDRGHARDGRPRTRGTRREGVRIRH